MKKKKKKRTVRMGRVLFVLALLAGLAYGVYRLAGVVIKPQFVIMIDPAFGGGQTGLQGYVDESEYARKLCDQLVLKLEEERGIKTLVTHSADVPMSVEQRAAVIAEAKPDLVLSIRCDYSPDEYESGMVIYADPASRNARKSMTFAEDLAKAFETSGWYPYTVKTGYGYFSPVKENTYQVILKDERGGDLESWPLMEQTDETTVICSALFVTNQEETAFMTSDEAYENAAELYLQAVRAYAGK